ncbi:hypothetical protein [Limosilactobacillus caviae]|nr:hypothetical protein [Limosilactobacillus caviae]MCD7123677.1 hypothetical protein [Limosilactobacillus caviae]MRH46539.1 hypothetical protein [Limosilactobacillus reuteri]
MLWLETVLYRGNEHQVISTYSDGTVDLDNGLNVNQNEVEVLSDGI